ncbi:glycoside hydrolase family 28 protein [Aquiflexum sp.]|uniref:glycoside hydrolase family 28 protein n=1 Tax=Aquiflexum sp. TaxID=1872584 RepID=UPI0035934C02
MIQFNFRNSFFLNYFWIILLLISQQSCEIEENSIEKYGGIGDGITDNTLAIQKAIDVQHSNGGGEVRLVSGVYLSGTIHLKSNVTLIIEQNATLKAIPDASAFPLIQSQVPSRMDKVPWKSFIRAESQENITIKGGGAIDGSGDAACFQDNKPDSPNRPYGLLFIDCQNVVVEDLRLKSSAFWMQRYFQCKYVRIFNLNVFNHVNKNNDGLDIDSSENVIVRNCIIDSSDDALVIKSESDVPAKNIQVYDCELATHASAIKLGTASIGGFEDIIFSDIMIRKSKADTVHHPLNFENGMTGIDLAAVDGGEMKRISISNIKMEGLENPIHIKLGNRLSKDIHSSGNKTKNELPSQPKVSKIADIMISSVEAQNGGPYPIVIAGFEGNPIKNVTLKDITIKPNVAGNEESQDSEINWNHRGYPFILSFKSQMPAYGIVSYYTEGLRIENLNAIPAYGEKRPKEKHFFRYE